MPTEYALIGLVQPAAFDKRTTHADGTSVRVGAGNTAARRPRVRALGILLRRTVRRVRRLLRSWRRRVVESNELRTMSDRELRDFGISRYDAEHAAKQAFWKNSAGRL